MKSKMMYVCILASLSCLVLLLYAVSQHFLKHHNITTLQQIATGSNCRNYSKRLPHCVVIGVDKSGTEALKVFMNFHPDVKFGQHDQYFFQEEAQYLNGIGYYRQQMPHSCDHQITVVKTPLFTFSGFAERVRLMNESVKLILLVREPVARLVSQLVHFNGKTIEGSILAKAVVDKSGQVNVDNHAVQQSMYHLYTKVWLNTFTRDQIHIVNGDDLVTNPYTVLYGIETFLDLGHKLDRNRFIFNETTGFHCYRNDEPPNLCRPSSKKGRGHPTIDPNVLEILHDFFRHKNELFFKTSQVAFDW